ncbi:MULTISPECIES: acetyl-CoA hydrolase/transferase C-terminal domain-containing protein [Pseudonocardia]|uniref:Succinyl-CoA:coenzyme A transferase n=2 Tax=Pseudonocardia TaxID=1847 RepID=A0A1Y2MUM4_PSEAH|nr:MULTISPECIES: acetyl-CoA hydrolase/transferase C-terminal domain-containing protein [Pseudonocardia]OSY38886.1 Succinyl-CoA:coenzyme A transferase [Pseudonocardia autotrophica]TDN76142.1 acyl-CoA hydrolase [Pseudonocardia autotrophica]BBG00123.1 4-hydroxybutyrate CoA-transferase [Pseudonocardia autotrophica]GEC26088.1 4-hydroxybutyrate CoA-transferase [Pseudonocardia saturnea]
MTSDPESALAALVSNGSRVALADGCGTPRTLHGPLSRVAAGRAVSAVLGWHPAPAPDLDPAAFDDVRVLMGGPGTRAAVESGAAHVVPARLSAVPALLRGPLRPDLLVATVVRGPDGLRFGAEVGYLRGLVDSGTPVAAVLSHGSPCSDAGPALPAGAVTVVAETAEGPAELTVPAPTTDDEAIARRVAALVPPGARIQVGPGRLAAAMAAAIEVPVRLDSGLLPDPVVDLDARGLLLDQPVSTYLAGTRRLYDWADGRALLHPVEHTHDIGRLSAAGAPPLIALNAALEIDVDGQVNVEGLGRSAAGMIGGHPDFAAAGARGDGLSVIALASLHRGAPTLVERLSRPVSTPSQDVDLVVTERGTADLRGLDRAERRRALLELWDGAIS